MGLHLIYMHWGCLDTEYMYLYVHACNINNGYTHVPPSLQIFINPKAQGSSPQAQRGHY